MAVIQAIFRGRRHVVVEQTENGIWLEQIALHGSTSTRVHVAATDPDLIIDPTDDDLDIAAAYERGEISAFEYLDGHTYPPGCEIGENGPNRTPLRKFRVRLSADRRGEQ